MAKKKTRLELHDEVITSKIYLVRGQKVMLDRDLAELYGVKAIRLREQVKRNTERFPGTFMFQLTSDEVENMVSQNAIPSRQHLGGYLPYAFTEHGVLMLANILKSEQAIKMSIRIIEIFVRLRELILTHKDILLKLEQMEKNLMEHSVHLKKHDEEIQLIFSYLKKLLNPAPPQRWKRIKGYKRSDEE